MIDFKARLAAAKLAANPQPTPEQEPAPKQEPVEQVGSLKPLTARVMTEAEAEATPTKPTFAELLAAKAKAKAKAEPAPEIIPLVKPKSAFLAKLEELQPEPETEPVVQSKPIAPVKSSFLDTLKAKAAARQAVPDPSPSAPPVQPAPVVAPKMTAETGLTFLQKLQAKKLATAVAETLEVGEEVETNPYTFGAITLNKQQAKAPVMAATGQSFVLTGAAGTGKTATQAAVIESLDKAGAFKVHDFKYIGEAPSVALVAFTKVAVRNIQKALRKNDAISHYAAHCMTVHSLLEFIPVVETRLDEDGNEKNVRIFRPQRHAGNPLKITHLVVEEASMIGTDLWELLYDALMPDVQIVFLGDINQIKPVFGDPILAYALKQLEVVELTEVYRTEDGSPIIPAAHEVLNGRPFTNSDCGRVSILSGKSKYKVTQAAMGRAMIAAFRQLFDAGAYDPDLDIILCPWNKRDMGTTAINEGLATYLGVKRGALVQEVRAGFNRWWLAEGDKVLVDKRQGYIVNIQTNPKYVGQSCMPAGSYTRSGIPILGDGSMAKSDAEADWDEMADYSNFSLSDIADDEDAPALRAASHIVTVRYNDQDDDDFSVTEISTSGEFAPAVFQFGYALTVHKAQGSEWRNVYFMAHYDHLGFLCRELVYTALTRASETFTFFGKEDLLAAAVAKVSIKGDTLADKIEYFSSGLRYDESIKVTKPSVKLAD